MNEYTIEQLEQEEMVYPDWVIVSPRGKLSVNEVAFY